MRIIKMIPRCGVKRLLPSVSRLAQFSPALSRGVRTRRNTTPLRPSPTQTLQSPPPSQPQDLDNALKLLDKVDSLDVQTSADLLLLDQLNMSRPGTRTDKRYKNQKKKLAKLSTQEDKTRALAEFLIQEVNREIFHHPNSDEIDVEEEINGPQDLERSLEYGLKKSVMNNWGVSNERYRMLEILLRLLENIRKDPELVMLIPVEKIAAVFEMAQYLEDDTLKHRTRYLTGQMIYDTKKVEMDPINESLFIEALMELNKYREAEKLLIKRATDVDQRWWYELLVVNYIDQLRFDKAEEAVDLIKQKYGSYIDPRIYLLFINSYLSARNLEKASLWTEHFKDFTQQRGFLTGQRQEPGLGATEEDTLLFLNREDQPTKDEFLQVVATYLKGDDLHQQAADLVDFFLKQPGTRHEDIALKLLDFKLMYQTKIVPLLEKMSDSSAVSFVTEVLEEVKSLNPVQSEQEGVFEDLLLALAKVGGFEKVMAELQRAQTEDGELTQRHFYSLIIALLKADRVGDAERVLDKLELSHAMLQEDPELNGSMVIPPVNSYHYMAFVRHFGRSKKHQELQHLLTRFQNNYNLYNPAFLTQVLSSLNKFRDYNNTINIIDAIILQDIHKQDASESDDLRRLYSMVWACIRDVTHAKLKNKSVLPDDRYPDLRVVFLKMIEDRVVPTPDDYSTIVKTFIMNFDFYPLPCVLQYMGKVHQVRPTPELLRAVERLYNKKNGQLVSHTVNETYSEKLMLLQKSQQTKNSLDPFPSQERDETEMESGIHSVSESADSELLWRVALARVLDVLENLGAEEAHMKSIHEQFGLVYDMRTLFASAK